MGGRAGGGKRGEGIAPPLGEKQPSVRLTMGTEVSAEDEATRGVNLRSHDGR